MIAVAAAVVAVVVRVVVMRRALQYPSWHVQYITWHVQYNTLLHDNLTLVSQFNSRTHERLGKGGVKHFDIH